MDICLEITDCIGEKVNLKKFNNSSNTICWTFAAEANKERRPYKVI